MIGRKRDRYWLSRVLAHLGKGMPVQEALDDATRSCFPSVRKDEAVQARSLTQLRKPEICQAIEDAFAACGFTLEDAIRTHIGHIKGEHTKQVLAGGEIVELRLPPSYAALQGYQKLVLPAQTSRVQIEHSNINEMLKTVDMDEATAMRTVGEVIDVEPEEDPDDRDPFEDEEEEEES